ncbi:MAG: glutaminyl-peptide cyclotransferase [Pseudomonadota bacterium]
MKRTRLAISGIFLVTIFSKVYGAPVYSYRIINTYPHDPQAFTQGLIYHNDHLYESTGLWGRSSLRKVALMSGKVLQIRGLQRHLFGEGITRWQNQIIQLTWRSRIGFVYRSKTFEELGHFSYNTEGWGITHDGQKLIMSDGTDKLYFLNAKTFEKMGHIEVRDKNKPIFRLNELEYVEGEIFANVWQSDYIVRISPLTGQVLGWIDLSGLLEIEPSKRDENVLNGIAYDGLGKRLFVTGKFWPKLFEIEVVKAK